MKTTGAGTGKVLAGTKMKTVTTVAGKVIMKETTTIAKETLVARVVTSALRGTTGTVTWAAAVTMKTAEAMAMKEATAMK